MECGEVKLPSVTSTGGAGGELWKHHDRYLHLLTAESKQVRRKTLETILAEAKALPRRWSTSNSEQRDSDDDEDEEGQEQDCSSSISQTDGVGVKAGGDISTQMKSIEIAHPSVSLDDVKLVIRPLLNCLFDPVEKCREISYETLTLLFQRIPKGVVAEHLNLAIPNLIERLGQPELIESSEEVRLLAVKFMRVILVRMDKDLSNYVDDWIKILSVTIVDPYHEVRKESCELTSLSSHAMSHVFHYNSERLVKPLCVSITHQQSKVRVAVVHCIGDVLLRGSHKSADDFIPHLTQRLFDPQRNVRKAVVGVVGSWMMNFVDRYSYFHKFLPLIITGLCDDCDDVRELGEKLWEKVGDKYLEENIEEYKDAVDFPLEFPSHYPEDVKRPNFGCRLLTQRNACKIIPGVKNDITDWVDSTRLKCAQLLFHLILNCEEKITMHVQLVIDCLFKSACDLKPDVVKYILKSAKLVGYFVPLTTSWQILESSLTSMSSTPREGNLAVIASIIEGSNPSVLEQFAYEMCFMISRPEVCLTLKTSCQFWILKCCEGLMRLVPSVLMVTPETNKEQPGELLFRTLISVLAMAQDGETQAKAIVGLEQLFELSGLKSRDELFSLGLQPILKEIKDRDGIWSAATPDKLLFSAILTHAGSGMEEHMELISEILVLQLAPEKDPQVRLNLFTLLSEIVDRYSSEGCSRDKIPGHLQLFLKTIIQDVLNPSLTWRAGKTASALRAAASGCFLRMLEEELVSPNLLSEILDEVVSGCLGLLEDTYHLNRLIGVQCLGRTVQVSKPKSPPHIVNKIYPELLKRLDDEKNEVRFSSAIAIGRVFDNLPEDYSVDFFKAHFEFILNVLLVHLDDEDEEIQRVIFDSVKSVGRPVKELAIEKCTAFRGKHRSTRHTDNLIQFFKVREEL